MLRRIASFSVVILALSACPRPQNGTTTTTGGGQTPPEGQERGPCRADHTCDAPLICLSDTCVRPEAGSSSGMVGGSSTSTAASEGGSGTSGTASGTSETGASSSSMQGASGLGTIPVPQYDACAVVAGSTPMAGQVHPGDDVRVTLAGFPIPGGMASSWHWVLERAPVGSNVALASADTEATGLITSDGPGPDVIGTYILGFTVMGQGGAAGGGHCSIVVTPAEALAVQLSWNTVMTDLDLRMLKKDAAGHFCLVDANSQGLLPATGTLASACTSPFSDCSYSNCKTQSATSPNWDMLDTHAGDPLLARDDISGRGPERIGILAPVAGDYLVAVHAYALNGNAGTRATVRVFVRGKLRAQYEHAVTEREWWEPLVIHWPQGQGDVCLDAAGTMACSIPDTCDPMVPADCGPGTVCNAPTQRCEPTFDGCSSSAQCAPGLACIPSFQACAAAECAPGGLVCGGVGQVCDPTSLSCIRPPPVCMETDEPNDTPMQATALPMPQMGTSSLMGTICRGDVDVLGIPVPANKRIRASVLTLESGMTLELLDATGATLRTTLVSPAVSATVLDAQTIYVRITLGQGSLVDQVSYALTVDIQEPPTCSMEPGEPNETRTQATNSVVPAGATMRTICTAEDVDNHLFHAQAGKRVSVSIGSMQFSRLTLNVTDGAGAALGTSFDGRPVIVRTGADMDLVITVAADVFADLMDPELYTLQIEETDPPSCMLDAAQEPNDTRATAFPLTAAHVDGVSCDVDELDFYTFTSPAAGVATLELATGSGADLDLFLYDALTGGPLMSATTGINPERLMVPLRADGTYWLEVRPYSAITGMGVFPADYQLTLTFPGSTASSSGTASSQPASSQMGASEMGTSSSAGMDSSASQGSSSASSGS